MLTNQAIKLYWHKYSVDIDRYSSLGFFDPEISFNDWFLLYQCIEDLNIDETILDQPFKDKGTKVYA